NSVVPADVRAARTGAGTTNQAA
ncbi:MAG: hypothetical protein QG655_3195, partial [Actinomycetota bacterium]|nr:hypothetical protein [Actinomycetota bacterium]